MSQGAEVADKVNTPPADARGGSRQPAEADLSGLPPLAATAAWSAFVAACINRVMLIILEDRLPRVSLLELSRIGQFATSIAVISGLVALLTVLVAMVRGFSGIRTRRRFLIAGLVALLTPIIAVAAFLPREQTSGDMVWIGCGAAHALVVLVAMNGAHWARSLVPRAVAVTAASMATLTLGAVVLQRLFQPDVSYWQLAAFRHLQRAGEAAYLVTLLGAALMAIPRRAGIRDMSANFVALVVFSATGLALYVALSYFRGPFILTLQYALRVSWLIDRLPMAYVLVICASWAAAIGSQIGTEPSRRETGLGILLMLSCGFGPRSPERLLTYALAIVLITRVTLAPAARSRTPRDEPVP